MSSFSASPIVGMASSGNQAATQVHPHHPLLDRVVPVLQRTVAGDYFSGEQRRGLSGGTFAVSLRKTRS